MIIFKNKVLVKCIGTSISGNTDKHDSELRDQLEMLRKKIRIKNFNLVEKLNEQRQSRKEKLQKQQLKMKLMKRSNSVNDLAKIRKELNLRTSSAESKSNSQTDLNSNLVSSKEVLKNNLEREIKKRLERGSNQSLERTPSPTSSILKTSTSPRAVKSFSASSEKKQVKFNSKETHHHLDSEHPKQGSKEVEKEQEEEKLVLDLNWIMSISYIDAKINEIHAIRTLENFDKNLKSIDNKLVNLYDRKSKKFSREKSIDLTDNDEKEVVIADEELKAKILDSIDIENVIHIFECKKWLAKDMEDKKIKRTLKLSNVLKATK